MRASLGIGVVVASIAIFGEFGGASEPQSRETWIASAALARVPGCDRFQITESDRFLKRIGAVCDDGQAHWISYEAVLKVDGQEV